MIPVLSYRIPLPMAEAERVLREALKGQGFGILTEVDVQATFREKLGIETAPYRILGACNPKIAHAALDAEPASGAFLPCGIALYQGATAGETHVAIQNPGLISQAFAAPGLEGPAHEAQEKLMIALHSIGEAVPH